MIPLHSLTMTLVLLAAALRSSDEPGKDARARSIARMVHYSGKVQGVGFRATAVEIAKDYPVTGWVKNLSDGRVQMYVEGAEEPVEQFQKAIRKHWGKNIEKEQVEKKEPAGKFKNFTIMR